MIVVHHLNNSRSQRVLWLLEEMGLPYDIKRYERERSGLAPKSLRAVATAQRTNASSSRPVRPRLADALAAPRNWPNGQSLIASGPCTSS